MNGERRGRNILLSQGRLAKRRKVAAFIGPEATHDFLHREETVDNQNEVVPEIGKAATKIVFPSPTEVGPEDYRG